MQWIEDVVVPPYRPLVGGRFLHPYGVTLLFGHGGTGKGYIAAALTHRLAREGTRVGVLDFEQQSHEWKSRLDSAPRGMVAYEELSEDIAAKHTYIRECVADLGLQYLIVDSAARALPEPMKGQTETAAVRRTFAILHDFGCPCLLIAHVPKGGMRDGEPPKHVLNPLGSVQYTNQSRLTWSAIQTELQGPMFRVETRCMKVNDRPRPDTRTWEFNPEAGVCNVYAKGAQVFNASRAIWQRLMQRERAMTAAELSHELMADFPTHDQSLTRIQVQRLLYRRNDLFRKVHGGFVALDANRLIDKWGDDDDSDGWVIG